MPDKYESKMKKDLHGYLATKGLKGKEQGVA